jgi:NAD+ diphosphatase
MDFIKSAIEPATIPDNAYFFVFSDNGILVKKESENHVSIPYLEGSRVAKSSLNEICFLGKYNEIFCYCARITPESLPYGYKLINLRSLYGKIDNGFWGISGYARQICDWNINFKFCGRCGAETKRKKNEHVRICPICKLTNYPRISPAIITAVVKDNKILLARGVNFPNKKMFSVLAGFVEPGETLEECVVREIFEETRIKVKKIQYFKSQSWPFPDSLMIGFTAEYKSGNLFIDTREIVDAGWFTAGNLPVVPGKYTLAGELIEWFVLNRG